MITQTTSYILITIASLIAAAMIVFGLFVPRRAPIGSRGSRRWIFVVGGLIGAACSLFAGIVQEQRGFRANDALYTLLASAIGVCVGIGLLFWGLRGRWVGDHPYCRKCGFDLFGKPDSSKVCSECGADLERPKATRIGERQRRLGFVFAALFALFASVSVGVPSGIRVFQRMNWQTVKPDWWLFAELESSNTAGLAFNSLELRLVDGKLDRDEALHLLKYTEQNAGQRYLYPLKRLAIAWLCWRQGYLDDEEIKKRTTAAIDKLPDVRLAAKATREYGIPLEVLRTDAISPMLQIEYLNWTDQLGSAATMPSTIKKSPIGYGWQPHDVWLLAVADESWKSPPLGSASVSIGVRQRFTLQRDGNSNLTFERNATRTGVVEFVTPEQLSCPAIQFADPTTRPDADQQPFGLSTNSTGSQVRFAGFGLGSRVAMLVDVFVESDEQPNPVFAGTAFGWPDFYLELTKPLPPGKRRWTLKPAPEKGSLLFRVVPIYDQTIVVDEN